MSYKIQTAFRLDSDLLEALKERGVLGVSYQTKPLIIWFQMESPDVIRLIRISSYAELFK